MVFASRASLIFPDFAEFIACLNANRVRYLIVGAYAVGFHARPRATKDIDVLLDRTPANARRGCKAITSFLGSSPPNVTDAALMNPRTLIVLGVAPVRIDILTSIDGITSSRRRGSVARRGTTAMCRRTSSRARISWPQSAPPRGRRISSTSAYCWRPDEGS
jgi:hypothetical protein